MHSVFTQKCTSTYTHPLHTAAFVHRSLYTRKLLHRPSCHAEGRRRGTRNSHFTTRLDLRHAQSPHRVTFPWLAAPATNLRTGNESQHPIYPYFFPRFFFPTDFSTYTFHPPTFSPQTFQPCTLTHRLFTHKLFTHKLFSHRLFTNRLTQFSPIHF